MIKNSWFYTRVQRHNPVIRLFCFPFAGGGCGTFYEWPKCLPESVEVVCLQMPGRGTRFKEKPYTNVFSLIDAFLSYFREVSDVPFVFFGHSMGSLIAYELAVHLTQSGHREPLCLYVSGMEAPSLVWEDTRIPKLPATELIEYLRQMNGMPEEILSNPEVLTLILPAIRADFELTGTYKFTDYQLGCRVIAFCGTDDHEVRPEMMEDWKKRTSGEFQLYTLPGDHFFLNSTRAELLALINEDLMLNVLSKE